MFETYYTPRLTPHALGATNIDRSYYQARWLPGLRCAPPLPPHLRWLLSFPSILPPARSYPSILLRTPPCKSPMLG